MCPDRHRDRHRFCHAAILSPALRARLAARLGPLSGAQPIRLNGGRSALAMRLGSGCCAVVIKISHITPDRPNTVGDAPVRLSGANDAGRPDGAGPGGPLFHVDPRLEIRVMTALARRDLAAKPVMALRHGPAICLAYPFQRGHSGQPPSLALARLLRRLHALPRWALPHLPGPSQDRASLLTRALDMLAGQPDGPALAARVETAAACAARPLEKVPLHGDPVPGNVVHGPRGVRLIDWHSAHRGDACHDIALALSPAMQVIHGLPPCTASRRAAFLAAYGCPATTARFTTTVAFHHALMIGHCLWRLDRGDRAYGPARDAEIAALRALPDR